MNFYYPWIDPRVKQVRPEQMICYLRTHAWREEGLAREHFIRYRHPSGPSTVLVPTPEETDDLPLCILDAVTMLAKAENRYAGDVLNDLLAQPAAEAEATTPTPVLPQRPDAMVQPANR